ncbi:beta-phosphoglucomutase [Paenibacillus curdlanolyticus YK9]|uniref:Beta-phosphoglucomutase n=1 Tax=Paenibacillus curdlanolyticus YK9 TaxID=717606 RepID=E0IF05_9BACL|nr:beta-phosphoglucomutase [Paenibacillus curdlanolyticus YK9]
MAALLDNVKGALFDLDGVLVDTAKYHYLAWKQLAEELGFAFTEADNERLKGVSRTRSLEIVLEVGGVSLSEAEKHRLAEEKNERYLQYIRNMDESELLPGAKAYLLQLKEQGVRIALGSASKNAVFILEKVGILELFDSIVDGTKVSKAKPDPEVFTLGCHELGLTPQDCVVFEDAEAGVQAAIAAGMYVVGIGSEAILGAANRVVRGLDELVA